MTQKQNWQPRALDLLEEAVFLLRRAPAGAWLCYGAGVLPFVAGLLFFWADMSRNPLAGRYASVSALGLALLFVWMKCGQALFAARLRSTLQQTAPPQWTIKRLLRLFLQQCAWQPVGLVLLPLALLVTVPFGWTYAFYQNLVVLAAPEPDAAATTRARAWSQARLWIHQNHTLILALSLLAFVIFLNCLILMGVGPGLLKRFTGIETPFTRSMYSYLNTTFLMVCAALTFIVLDPLVKAVYLLRCFYGEARHTGSDLRLQLRVPLTVWLAGVVLCLGAGATKVQAQEATVSPQAMDSALEEVMTQREYRWRLPRLSEDSEFEQPTWLKSFFQWWEDWIEKLLRKLKRRTHDQQPTSPGWMAGGLDVFIYILAGILLVVILYLGGRALLLRHKGETVMDTATAVTPAPDLEQEDVAADALPTSGWLALVDELMGRGDYRLALRACFLAQLAQLADAGHIAVARFKTNRDYERELGRRAHVFPQLIQGFHDNRYLFESVWYGDRPAEPTLIQEFRQRMTSREAPAL